MQFDRAMSLLLSGYPVTRAAWNGRKEADGETIHRAIVPSAHGFHFEGRRTIYGREQDFSNTLALTSADLAADDWSATPPDSDAVRADPFEQCAKEAEAQAELVEQMRGVYPGDPTGALGRDANKMRKLATAIRTLSNQGSSSNGQ